MLLDGAKLDAPAALKKLAEEHLHPHGLSEG
jgi:hypothetical protein